MIALAALDNKPLAHADTANACAQALADHVTSTCACVDEQTHAWCQDHCGVDLPPGTATVLPVVRALTGHPGLGAIWEACIEQTNLQPMELHHTTHEQCLPWTHDQAQWSQ